MGKKQTLHPGDIVLQRYREGVLEDEVRVKVTGHLEGCERCRHTVASYARLDSLLSEYAAVTVPEELPDQIVGQLLTGDRVSLTVRSASPVAVGLAGRAWAVAGGVLSLALAGLLLVWPLFGAVGGVEAAAIAVLKQAIVSLHFAGRIVESVLLVLEPLRSVGLVAAAASLAVCGLVAGRRHVTQTSL